MASSGKDVLRRRINELEEQVEELEEKTKEESIPDYGYGINDDSL
ncbi:MAG: hypothetical protein WC793_01375 [Candidatus Paceibacterota bacterium]